MLKKIISGGQTGADQAALDVALKFDIDHGGFVPQGRLTEKGILPLKYRLTETGSSRYPVRTRKNIEHSDGTLIISRGPLTGGSLLTHTIADQLQKPFCHIDLFKVEDFEAAMIVKDFVSDNEIDTLNVAGPRLSHCPGIYTDVKTVLEAMLYLYYFEEFEREFKDQGICFSPSEAGPLHITDPERIVSFIIQDLSFRQKIFIARLERHRIGALYFSMLDYLVDRFSLIHIGPVISGQLMPDSDTGSVTPEDAAMAIVKKLKLSLESDYVMKVIK